MDFSFFADQIFNGNNFVEKSLPKGTYECCVFKNCIFSNCDISNVQFVECEFEFCDLSMANVTNTVLRDVKFTSCKLTGILFNQINSLLFSGDFEECQLDLCVFEKCDLQQCSFKNCKLTEADFAAANLSNLNLENCDLTGALFANTNLEKTQLDTSFNYTIDPEMNKIKQAVFSMEGLPGLLSKYDIKIN